MQTIIEPVLKNSLVLQKFLHWYWMSQRWTHFTTSTKNNNVSIQSGNISNQRI